MAITGSVGPVGGPRRGGWVSNRKEKKRTKKNSPMAQETRQRLLGLFFSSYDNVGHRVQGSSGGGASVRDSMQMLQSTGYVGVGGCDDDGAGSHGY